MTSWHLLKLWISWAVGGIIWEIFLLWRTMGIKVYLLFPFGSFPFLLLNSGKIKFNTWAPQDDLVNEWQRTRFFQLWPWPPFPPFLLFPPLNLDKPKSSQKQLLKELFWQLLKYECINNPEEEAWESRTFSTSCNHPFCSSWRVKNRQKPKDTMQAGSQVRQPSLLVLQNSNPALIWGITWFAGSPWYASTNEDWVLFLIPWAIFPLDISFSKKCLQFKCLHLHICWERKRDDYWQFF